MPEAGGGSVAERRVDDQHDHATVDLVGDLLLLGQPVADQRTRGLTQRERQQQLQRHAHQRATQRHRRAAGADHQTHQQRGQRHADQARDRGVEDGAGHVATCHRCHRHRRRHRGRQCAQIEHAQQQLGRQRVAQRQHQQHADDREHDIRERLHEHMQTPMLGTRHELVTRQCGAVQEKHQGDTEIGDHAKAQRAVTGSDFRGNQRDADGGQHDQHEPVDQVVDLFEGGENGGH